MDADPPAGAPPDDSGTTRTSAGESSPGSSFGPYRLLQKIGEGGMGEVWRAEQRQPILRQVALKLIKPGMDTHQAIARFEAERQALALMDHPAIAKVFEAGSTPQGRLYFAMEYVRGEPITSYCDGQRLSTRERLDLFTRVCEGVQHAHQKGIIHRDLKPSNVLVALQDGQASPRIIDFGVAKATTHHLTGSTLFTEMGVLIGTPEYMSPEQAELTGLDIDTRTDVYALGVLLYELLTGSLPFDVESLRAKGLDEIRRTIRESDPPRPSTRIGQLGTGAPAVAQRRRTEPARLAGLLRGDLDWITMKALEKERARRYGSASDLAADIGRHLHDQPVVAGPPGAAYRTRKFVRRHRFEVAAAATLLGLLLAFAATTLTQAVRIARARDRANHEAERANQEASAAKQVADFLVGLFSVSDPGEARGNSITAREILDQGAAKIGKDLASQPEIEARLMSTMGQVYQRLGLYDRSVALLRDALDVRRRIYGERHAMVAESLNNLGIALVQKGDYAAAEPMLRQALEQRRLLLGDTRPEVAETLNNLGEVAYGKGDYAEAESSFRQALDLRRRLLGNESEAVANSLNDVAMTIERARGDYTTAEGLLQEALDIRRRLFGGTHPDVAQSLNNLAMARYRKGDLAGAESLFRECLAMKRELFGERHPDLSATLGNLGLVLRDKGDYAAAEPLFRQVIAMDKEMLGPDHPDLAMDLNNLAELVRRKGDLRGAEALLRESVVILRKTDPEDNVDVANIRSRLGACLAQERKYGEAEPVLVSSESILEQKLGRDHPRTRAAIQRLVDLYTAQGNAAKASEWRSRLTG